jgi:hypothetical protein
MRCGSGLIERHSITSGQHMSIYLCDSTLAYKAEALHLADRTSEALEVVNEAEALVERFEERRWCAELHRLRGVFLTAIGAEETQRNPRNGGSAGVRSISHFCIDAVREGVQFAWSLKTFAQKVLPLPQRHGGHWRL